MLVSSILLHQKDQLPQNGLTRLHTFETPQTNRNVDSNVAFRLLKVLLGVRAGNYKVQLGTALRNRFLRGIVMLFPKGNQWQSQRHKNCKFGISFVVVS